jgi:hypothetical protein
VVGLSRSTYYDIKFHQPGYREIRHLLLADLIVDIHTERFDPLRFPSRSLPFRLDKVT